MRPLAALLLLAVLAPPARAEEVSPAPLAREAATPVPAKASAWHAGARPPSDVPPTAIVRAAERTEKEEKEAGAARRKAEARTAENPPPPVEIIWHAPGSTS